MKYSDDICTLDRVDKVKTEDVKLDVVLWCVWVRMEGRPEVSGLKPLYLLQILCYS